MDLLTGILTFVLAGAGAYLGAYLKRKGENWATHEDVEKLVKQVAAVTTVTKKIEGQISDEFWQQQRRYEAKRDTIFEAMKKLGELEAAFATYAANLAAARIGSPGAIKEYDDVRKEFFSAMRLFGIAKNMVTLACGPEGHRVLSSFQRKVSSLAANLQRNEEEVDLSAMFNDVGGEWSAIYEYLGGELGIKPTPLSTESSAAPSPDPPNPEADIRTRH